MNDPNYDIHPLDRDYSEPPPEPEVRELTGDERLRRFGVIVFGAGFALVFLCAITLNVFRGPGWIESFVSGMNRFASIAILVGGIMILVSYRLAMIQRSANLVSQTTSRANLSTLTLLIVVNVVVFVLLITLSGVASLGRAPTAAYLIYNAVITTACALMVTMVVWHRGMLRAYAIGVIVAMLFNGLSLMFVFNSGFGPRADGLVVPARLATIQFSGLVCAGYVSMLVPSSKPMERKHSDDEPDDN